MDDKFKRHFPKMVSGKHRGGSEGPSPYDGCTQLHGMFDNDPPRHDIKIKLLGLNDEVLAVLQRMDIVTARHCAAHREDTPSMHDQYYTATAEEILVKFDTYPRLLHLLLLHIQKVGEF